MNTQSSILATTGSLQQNARSKQVVNVAQAGALELRKFKIDTAFDVCHDTALNPDRFEDFWILEHGGNYWHWLKPSLKTTSDKDNKPEIIPATVDSYTKLSFTAVFAALKTLTAAPKIRATNNSGYQFAQQTGSTSGEFSLVFTASNIPHKGTVQFFEQFNISFDYSVDNGTTWINFGMARVTLYLTWKKPASDVLSITCSKTSRPNIYETLLWIGCKQAKGAIPKESKILDSVFDDFLDLKVIRRREGATRPNKKNYFDTDNSIRGLGYWRGGSSISAGFSGARRFETVLLHSGEARCGEWTDFFLNICIAVGANLRRRTDTIGIAGTVFGSQFQYFNLSSNYDVNKPSTVFCVRNATITKVNDIKMMQQGVTVSGKSKGQGTDNAQPTFVDHFWFYYDAEKRFFDASYGIKYTSTNSKLKKYCADNLSSIVVVEQKSPTSPLTSTIVTTNIHDYVASNKDLFI
jgi:hypothetical protein